MNATNGSLTDLLAEPSPPSALLKLLSDRWDLAPLTPSSSSSSKDSRQNHDLGTGARALDGAPLLAFVLGLVERRAAGVDKLMFLSVSKAGVVNIIHSLVVVRDGEYDDAPALWGIRGDIPDHGLPSFVSLSAMDFAANTTFLGQPSEEFESHATGLASVRQKDLDSSAYQASAVGDEGARTILSRGLSIINAEGASAFTSLNQPVVISEVSSRVVPVLIRSSDPYAQDTLDWLQASFTAREDGKFVSGPIRTSRKLAEISPVPGSFAHAQVMAHLRQTFPRTYTSPSTSLAVNPTPPPTPSPPTPTPTPAATPTSLGSLRPGGSMYDDLPELEPPRRRRAGPGPLRTDGQLTGASFSRGEASPVHGLGPPHGIDIAAIVGAAVKAATEAVAASSAAAGLAPPTSSGTPSDLKLCHLRHLVGTPTNDGIPAIWSEVQACTTKQAGLSLLVQHLMAGMGACRKDFFGHADILHCSIPLYNFVAGDRFVNPGENPACPAGGMSMWTTLQGRGDVGSRMATADADLAALDSRNAMADQISRAARVHLQTISGAATLQKEIGTKAYILDRLFGPNCPLTLAFSTELIPFIDQNFTAFERQVNTDAACTTFAYDLSRVEAAYYNSCIRASTSTATLFEPGSVTPASFQLLVDELRWGRYRGQSLPASLQVLLRPDTRSIIPPLVTEEATPADLGQTHTPTQSREGTPVANPRPVQRLRLRQGENTRGVLRSVALPTVNNSTFCKRWHLGMTCFSGCPRALSHVHPPVAVVDTVAAALAAERAAAAAAE